MKIVNGLVNSFELKVMYWSLDRARYSTESYFDFAVLLIYCFDSSGYVPSPSGT